MGSICSAVGEALGKADAGASPVTSTATSRSTSSARSRFRSVVLNRGATRESTPFTAAADQSTNMSFFATPEDEALFILRNGYLKILSSSWLMKRSYAMERCQDLPEEAFILPEKAAKLYKLSFGLVVLSYPWLTKKHPDPDGFYLDVLKDYLGKHSMFATQLCPPVSECGVFWDFCSLPQVGPDGTKSPKEREQFKKCLNTMNLVYGSPKTVVIQLTMLPDFMPPDANSIPYEKRGWCVYEATASSLAKPSHMLLNLGLQPARHALADEYSVWSDIQAAATAGDRLPPLLPEDMVHALQEAIFTNEKTDREMVTRKYEKFFEDTSVLAERLDFANKSSNKEGWGDDLMMQVAKALPSFEFCEDVVFKSHCFTDVAWEAICHQLPQLRYLKILRVEDCRSFSGSGFQALKASPMPLEQLRMRSVAFTDEGLAALASQFRGFQELQFMSLRSCSTFSARGFRAFAAQLPELPVLRSLHLDQSAMDDECLGALGEQLPRLLVLRKLTLDGSTFSGVGVRSLAGRAVPALEELTFRKAAIDEAGMSVLAAQFQSFACLRMLQLQGCRHIMTSFQDLGAHLHHLVALQELQLSDTAVDDIGMKAIAPQLPKLPALASLHLAGCKRIGVAGFRALAEQLPYMPSLEKLLLARTNLCDKGLSALLEHAPKSRLSTLCLNNSLGFSGLGFLSIAGRKLHNLQELDIGHSDLTSQGLLAMVQHLSALAELRRLVLSGCEGLGSTALQSLAHALPQLASLEVLDLSGTLLNDEGVRALVKHLPSLAQISELDLHSCRLIGRDSLVKLFQCALGLLTLHSLFLGDTAVDDKCLFALEELEVHAPLRKLDLRDCDNISEKGLTCLMDWVTSLPLLRSGATWGNTPNIRCPDNHDLSVTSLWAATACSICGQKMVLGSTAHACRECNWAACEPCVHGGLWIPVKLKQTWQGDSFVQHMVSRGGRHLSGFNWA